MDPGGSSLLGSLRNLADSVWGSAHDRLQLLGLELQEEKHRLIQVLIWLAAIVALGFLALIFASIALLVAFWETARLTVVICLAVGYCAGLVAAIVGFRRFLSRQPKPFAATL